MKVINIHQRVIKQPIAEIALLFSTLSSEDDRIMPTNSWPPMKLDNGLQIGSKGGHGPIKYQVIQSVPNQKIQFKFLKPEGFNGFHQFEIIPIDHDTSEIKHTIDMQTSPIASIKWLFAIRWLHDALIEDGFDKVENYFLLENKFKRSEWNFWVKFLRKVMKPKKIRNKKQLL